MSSSDFLKIMRKGKNKHTFVATLVDKANFSIFFGRQLGAQGNHCDSEVHFGIKTAVVFVQKNLIDPSKESFTTK